MKRQAYWDIIKGIAILLMILGHAILTSFKAGPVLTAIYSFHMPLFMVVSGYFYAFSLRHPAKNIVVVKIWQLIIPVLLFTTLDWLVFWVDPSSSLMVNLTNWYARLLRTLWFLTALFICSLTVLVGDRISKRTKKSFLPVYALIIIAFLLIPDFAEQAGMKAMFPFFLTGVLMNSPSFIDFYRKYSVTILVISILVFVVSLPIFRFRMTFYETGVCIFSGKESVFTLLVYDVFRYLIGMAGSLSIICGIELLNRRLDFSNRNLLANIGTHTLWIYIISDTLWHLYDNNLAGMAKGHYSWIIISFILLCVLSYPLALLCERLWDKGKKYFLHIFKLA